MYGYVCWVDKSLCFPGGYTLFREEIFSKTLDSKGLIGLKKPHWPKQTQAAAQTLTRLKGANWAQKSSKGFIKLTGFTNSK